MSARRALCLSSVAVLLGVGCAPDPPVEIDLMLSDDIQTVVLVDILDDLTDVSAANVEYGTNGVFDRRLNLDLTGDDPARATLVGLKTETDVSLRVVLTQAGDERSSEDQTITTGSQPSWLPSIYIEEDDGAQHINGDYLLTSNVTSPAAAIILDSDGDLVWWSKLVDARQVARVRLSRDGKGVYAMPVDVDGENQRGLIFTPWAGGDQVDIDVQGAHHDFVELADGTLGLIQREERIIADKPIIGDRIVEQALDGTQTDVWSTWDDIDPTLTHSDMEQGDDWSHANVLVYDQARDDWLISLLGIRAIARVDRRLGQLTWLLGSELGDFQNPAGEVDFLGGQHVFQLLSGGIIYFENGLSDDPVSRAVELALDEDRLTAEEVWSYTPDPSLYTFSLGGLDRLDDGDTVVTFSVNGRIDEVAPDGSLRWRISESLGGTFGFSEVVSLPGVH